MAFEGALVGMGCSNSRSDLSRSPTTTDVKLTAAERARALEEAKLQQLRILAVIQEQNQLRRAMTESLRDTEEVQTVTAIQASLREPTRQSFGTRPRVDRLPRFLAERVSTGDVEIVMTPTGELMVGAAGSGLPSVCRSTRPVGVTLASRGSGRVAGRTPNGTPATGAGVAASPSSPPVPVVDPRTFPVCEANEECLICMEDGNVHSLYRTLPCAHRFHIKCVDSWLAKNPTCPFCQLDLTNTPSTPGLPPGGGNTGAEGGVVSYSTPSFLPPPNSGGNGGSNGVVIPVVRF